MQAEHSGRWHSGSTFSELVAKRGAARCALRAALVFYFLVGPAGADAASAFDAREMPAPV